MSELGRNIEDGKKEQTVTRLGVGALVGVSTFLIGYVIIYLMVGNQVRAASRSESSVGAIVPTLFPPVWKAVAWVYYGIHGIPSRPLADPASEPAIAGKILFWVYSGHNIATTYEFSSGGHQFIPETDAVSNVAELMFIWPVWPLVLTVSATLLCGAGFLLGRRYAESVQGGTIIGASVIIGYGPMAIIGVFLTRSDISIYGKTVTIGPALVPTILLAGVIYPCIFGALGGASANGLLGQLRRWVRSPPWNSHG